MEQQFGRPMTLFYSYAHEDEGLRNKLEKHLSLLQRKGLIAAWHDRQIMPGADWSHTVDHHLNMASIILLLISPNFLASDYCYNIEMQRALERQRMGEALVIPVILCPVDWHDAPFAHLQCLPCDAKPVTEWENQDAALRDIAANLRLIIEKRLSSCSPNNGGIEDSREISSRVKYLNHLLILHSTVTLPLGPVEGFTLQAIFQPLTLRQDPRVAEDLQREKRRAFLGEPVPEDDKPVIVAHTSEEALQRSPQKRLVILGGPGTGKTTVLQYLIYEQTRKALVDPATSLPIFVSLPDLARSGKLLSEYLIRLTREAGIPDLFAETLGKVVEEGNAFICLDSLDEVAPDQRPAMIRTINELTAKAGNTWVVGSRFTEYKGGQFKRGGFTEWELQPMASTLRRELAKRLLPELYRLLQPESDRARGDEFLVFVNLLETHTQTTSWGENPLLFSLAAVVFVRLGTLPTSRAALYQQVVNAVLETREKEPARRKVLRRVLSDLALDLYRTKGRTFSLDDLLILLPIIRQRQHENWSTEEMAQRIIASGVLDVLAYETYGFRHQTFQEYLAAVELAQRLIHRNQTLPDETWTFAWGKRTYSRWTEVLRLMIGILVQMYRREGAQKALVWLGDLIRQQTQPKGDPGHLGLALALKSLTELGEEGLNKWLNVATIEEEIARSWATYLLDAAAQTRDVIHEEDRVGFTARRLGDLALDVGRLHEHAVKASQEVLFVALQDDDGRKRVAAARALGAFGAIMPMRELSPFFNHKDSRVRLAVMKTGGNRLSQEQLLTALEDENYQVRREAEAILGQQGTQVPIEIFQISLEHENGHVRASAARLLEKLGIPVPLEPLAVLLRNNHLESEVTQDLVDALGTVKSQASAELLLSFLMRRGSASFCATSAKALSKLGEYAPISSLVGLLHDRYIYARSYAAVALGGLGELAPIEPLLAALEDEHWYVRMRVAETLGGLGERVPVEPLVAILDRESGHLRKASADALEKLGERVPIEPFIAALPDSAVQSIAVRVLEKREGHVYVEALFDHASEHHIQAIAIQILGRINEGASMQFMIDALDDIHREVRVAAIEALGYQGERAPIPLLIDLLLNDEDVCYTAAYALGKLGEHVPLGPLIGALSDTNWYVRSAAIDTLGQLGARVPIELFVKALQDENDRVLWSVLNALEERKSDTLAQELITVLLNKTLDRVPRIMAAQLLEKQRALVPTEPLLDILYNIYEDEVIRAYTAKAIGNVGQLSLEFLMRSLHDANEYLRLMAVRALGKQEKQIATEPLIIALHDKNVYVREAAIEALELLNISIPEDISVVLLHDEFGHVRIRMWKFLATREANPPVDIFVQALNDKDLDARMEAANIIGNFGIPVPTEALLMALDDREERVQVAVIATLGKLGARVPVESLRAALGNSKARVRKAAVDVLQQNYPEILSAMIPNVMATLQEHRTEGVFASLKQCFFAKMSRHLTTASPELLDRLTLQLDWPYWEVQMYTCQALGKLRRNIPDSAIRRLLELRYHPQSRTVRDAADDALTDILSLETGIEDDEV